MLRSPIIVCSVRIMVNSRISIKRPHTTFTNYNLIVIFKVAPVPEMLNGWLWWKCFIYLVTDLHCK